MPRPPTVQVLGANYPIVTRGDGRRPLVRGPTRNVSRSLQHQRCDVGSSSFLLLRHRTNGDDWSTPRGVAKRTAKVDRYDRLVGLAVDPYRIPEWIQKSIFCLPVVGLVVHDLRTGRTLDRSKELENQQGRNLVVRL